MAKRDVSKPTYYLDSGIIIDLIENPIDKEPAKTIASIIEDGEAGRVNLVTSVVTISEAFYAKHEIEKGLPSGSVAKQIEQLWHPQSSPIRLVDVHEIIARDALQLLRDGVAKGWSKTRGLDCNPFGNRKARICNGVVHQR